MQLAQRKYTGVVAPIISALISSVVIKTKCVNHLREC